MNGSLLVGLLVAFVVVVLVVVAVVIALLVRRRNPGLESGPTPQDWQDRELGEALEPRYQEEQVRRDGSPSGIDR